MNVSSFSFISPALHHTVLLNLSMPEGQILLRRKSFITGIGSPLLVVKTVHLVDRADWFKISNLVYDGSEIVRSLYSSLQGQTVYGRYSELEGSLFVSIKTDCLGNFLEQLTL
jgi:hypothetical protein